MCVIDSAVWEQTASDIQYYADLAKMYLVRLWLRAMTRSSGSLAASLKKAKECADSLVPC